METNSNKKLRKNNEIVSSNPEFIKKMTSFTRSSITTPHLLKNKITLYILTRDFRTTDNLTLLVLMTNQ